VLSKPVNVKLIRFLANELGYLDVAKNVQEPSKKQIDTLIHYVHKSSSSHLSSEVFNKRVV
jgi:hypothetical protein